MAERHSSGIQAAFEFSFPSTPVPAPSPDADGKPCLTCGVWKPVDDYFRAKAGKMGRVAHCKACSHAAYLAANPPVPPPAPVVALDEHGSPVVKRCSDCGEAKPLHEFWRKPGGVLGRNHCCAPCARVRTKRPKSPPPAPLPPGMKRCTKCDAIKGLEGFYPSKGGAQGRTSDCKACQLGAYHEKRAKRPKPFHADGTPMTKTCLYCEEVLPFSAFGRTHGKATPDNPFNRHVYCKPCKPRHYLVAEQIERRRDAGILDATKRCPLCERERPLFDFHMKSNGGVPRKHCRSCVAAVRDGIPASMPGLGVPGHRLCTRCEEFKPADKFGPRPGKHGAVSPRCKDCEAQSASRWRKQNPAANTLQTVEYKAAKLKAQPKWLTPADRAEIAGVYLLASLFPGLTVDHVVPLKGSDASLGRPGRKSVQTVCGLHIAANLAPISAAENFSKGNRIVPGTERAEAPEFGTRRPIWDAASWWDEEWAAMGFPARE